MSDSSTRERNYVNMQVNPCKMCMPMGGSLALKGIRGAMTIIHGSQGCSTYIRRHMAAHFNEPVDIASSSLSEEGTVYGGAKNLKIGIANLVEMYKPEVVGVLTTCLAETIGDDIERIIREVRKIGDFSDVDLIPIPTPGYAGSQAEGYFSTIRAITKYYSEKNMPRKEGSHQKVNVIVSNATCEDIRELKRIFYIMDIDATIVPDISDVLDAPYMEEYQKLSSEGTPKEAFEQMRYAKATVELGDLVDRRYSTAAYLEDNYGVKSYRLPLPIGINNTDKMMRVLAEITQEELPEAINKERGRLIDGMIDAHKHSALGVIAVFGDMDLVYGISALLMENGMKIHLAATGTAQKNFKEQLQSLSDCYDQSLTIFQDTDFETIHEAIHDSEVNLMIGHSDGKFIWEKEGIDFIRVGFPVHDHVGAQRKLIMGYRGSLFFLDEIVNHLLDQKHINYRKRMYDAYYLQKEVAE